MNSELKLLMDEYLATLPEHDDDEVYTDSRSLAEMELHGFLQWLEIRAGTSNLFIATA